MKTIKKNIFLPSLYRLLLPDPKVRGILEKKIFYKYALRWKYMKVYILYLLTEKLQQIGYKFSHLSKYFWL